MAEMIIAQKMGRRKIHSLRVDLTPMVDLGFLLITFFMLSTTLAERRVLPLTMPDNSFVKDPPVFVAEATITLIPVKGYKLCYYNGELKDASQMKKVEVSKVRDVLIKKRAEVAALPASFSANAHKLHVLIKPDNSSTYADLVSLLDEMKILDVPYYTIVDITKEERGMMVH